MNFSKKIFCCDEEVGWVKNKEIGRGVSISLFLRKSIDKQHSFKSPETA